MIPIMGFYLGMTLAVFLTKYFDTPADKRKEIIKANPVRCVVLCLLWPLMLLTQKSEGFNDDHQN